MKVYIVVYSECYEEYVGGVCFSSKEKAEEELKNLKRAIESDPHQMWNCGEVLEREVK